MTITGTRDPKGRWLRILHEFLFSLNIALGLTSALVWRGVFVPLVDLAFRVNHQLGLKEMDVSGGYLAFLVYVAILTLVPFVLLRLLRRTSTTRWILIFAAGFLAGGIAPAIWFYIVRWYGWYPIESGIYLLFVAWYLRGRWVTPIVLAVLVATIHFGFWCQLFWEQARNPAVLLLPIIGFLSYLTWVRYVRKFGGLQ